MPHSYHSLKLYPLSRRVFLGGSTFGEYTLNAESPMGSAFFMLSARISGQMVVDSLENLSRCPLKGASVVL